MCAFGGRDLDVLRDPRLATGSACRAEPSERRSSIKRLGRPTPVIGMTHGELIGHVLVQGGETKEDRAQMRILDGLGLIAPGLGPLPISLGVPNACQYRQLRLACIQVRHDRSTFRLTGALPGLLEQI